MPGLGLVRYRLTRPRIVIILLLPRPFIKLLLASHSIQVEYQSSTYLEWPSALLESKSQANFKIKNSCTIYVSWYLTVMAVGILFACFIWSDVRMYHVLNLCSSFVISCWCQRRSLSYSRYGLLHSLWIFEVNFLTQSEYLFVS